jgi:hypothetical protein
MITKIYYAPLRKTAMETHIVGAVKETAGTETDQEQQTTSSKPGRPPPIVLTCTANLIKIQKDLK